MLINNSFDLTICSHFIFDNDTIHELSATYVVAGFEQNKTKPKKNGTCTLTLYEPGINYMIITRNTKCVHMTCKLALEHTQVYNLKIR